MEFPRIFRDIGLGLEMQEVQLQAQLEAQEEAEYAAFIEARLRRLRGERASGK